MMHELHVSCFGYSCVEVLWRALRQEELGKVACSTRIWCKQYWKNAPQRRWVPLCVR